MANLPRFGRTWQRQVTVAPPPPVPAAAPPASEPKPETTQTLQPLEPNPPPVAYPPSSPPRELTPRVSSPAKKAASPSASPKYRPTVTRVASPPVKPARSPPTSPAHKSYDRRQTTPPHSPAKSRRATAPPLSPMALPRAHMNANGTTAQSRIMPEVEQKSVLYSKNVDKPAKTDRQSEYGSGKAPQKQQADVINLAGHNVGAVMEINQSSGKQLGGEIIKKKETEGGVRHGRDERKTEAQNELPGAAFMNSNFQSVNNSVLFDSSCSNRDPGLHLAFSEKLDGDGSIVDGHKNYKP